MLSVIKRTIPSPLKKWLIRNIQPKILRRQYIRRNYPAVVGVIFSKNRCILKCRMCPQYNEPPKENLSMNMGLFKTITDQLPDSKSLRLEIASYGETLLTKDWQNMVRYAVSSKRNLHVIFVTNGVILTRDVCNFLLDYPPEIVQVSVDAATPEGYKWLTGNSAFEKTAENLRIFSKMRKEREVRRPKLHTHIIACKELQHEIKLFLDTWTDGFEAVGARPLGNWGGMIDENGITPLWSPPEKRYPCFWPFYATKIMPDGEVHKCHIHFLSGKAGVGFIQNESIEAIWKGKKMEEVRKKHLESAYSEEPMCEKCNVWALIPNIWKKGEYKEVDFTGKRYMDVSALYS